MADVATVPADVKVYPGEGALMASQTIRIGEAITQGDALYLNEDTSRWMKADNGTLIKAECYGFAAAAGSAEQEITLLPGGVPGQTIAVRSTIDFGVDLQVGMSYFLSSTAGKIHPASDLAVGDFVTPVGVAKALRELEINIHATRIRYQDGVSDPSDFNVDAWVRVETSPQTAYQDVAGTTPATTGTSVSLVIQPGDSPTSPAEFHLIFDDSDPDPPTLTADIEGHRFIYIGDSTNSIEFSSPITIAWGGSAIADFALWMVVNLDSAETAQIPLIGHETGNAALYFGVGYSTINLVGNGGSTLTAAYTGNTGGNTLIRLRCIGNHFYFMATGMDEEIDLGVGTSNLALTFNLLFRCEIASNPVQAPVDTFLIGELVYWAGTITDRQLAGMDQPGGYFDAVDVGGSSVPWGLSFPTV